MKERDIFYPISKDLNQDFQVERVGNKKKKRCFFRKLFGLRKIKIDFALFTYLIR